jgi:pentapeptide MXKDX repeat protein
LTEASNLLQRTLAKRFDRKETELVLFLAGAHFRCARTASKSRKIFQSACNKACRGAVLNTSGISRFQTASRRDHQPMTISTRIALGVSAAVVSLSLALAPAAFAQDKTGKDDAMKKDTMSKDTMKKDTMSKDTMSKDTMKKDDGMKKDSMKKDDGMKKN